MKKMVNYRGFREKQLSIIINATTKSAENGESEHGEETRKDLIKYSLFKHKKSLSLNFVIWRLNCISEDEN